MEDIEEMVDSTIDLVDRYLNKCSVEMAPDELDEVRDVLQTVLEEKLIYN